MAAVGHPGDTPLWDRIAERVAAPGYVHDPAHGPRDRLRAELAEQRAFALYLKDREREGWTAMAEAAELYGRAGLPWYELTARARGLSWAAGQDASAEAADGDAGTGRTGSWLPTAPEIREGLDTALAEAEALLAAGTEPDTVQVPGGRDPDDPAARAGAAAAGPGSAVEEYLTVLNCRAYAAYHQAAAHLPDIPADLRQRLDECVRRLSDEAGRLGVPHQRAAARSFTADVAARTGDAALAERELRAALADVAASGRPWRGTRHRAMLAQLLLAQDQPEEAVELLHQAVAEAIRHDDAAFPLAPTYALLGHAGSHTGDVAGAVRHLSEAAARFDRSGEAADAADTRMQLADLLARSGAHADAVAVLESVVAGEAAAGLDERLLAQARLTLGRGLRELEEYREAAEHLLRLADTVSAWDDDRAVLTLVAAEAAVTLAMAGDWHAAGAAYRRAVAAHAEAPNPRMTAHMMREFARLTMTARGAEDGLEAALAHLADADGVGAALPADAGDHQRWYELGSTHYRRGRVLAEAERFAEALAELEAAVAAHERVGEEGEAPRAEAVRVAGLVEGDGLGRHAAAQARLTVAAARCDQAGLAEAARVLRATAESLAARAPHAG
ncbi:hypothetical protein [Streptomyces sp. ODS05-4]|uniref:hypothetical protein n=1 Tax=Streptomyces sp. ODS05-4 TaxID=2944939 RepID=UPI00210A521D|nr:hypothetical protein [Streptomyces sp. ODS05-4]